MLKEVKTIKKILFFLIYLLIFCVGCSQNTEIKDTIQHNKGSIITSPSSTEDTPTPKISILPSNKKNNSSEENEMKITMMAIQNTYSSSTDKVNVIITNNTSFEFYMGMGYSIEYFNGSVWNKIPLEISINDVMITLSPQQSKEFSIYLYPEQYDYKSGKYRICKTVSSNDRTYELTSDLTLSS